MGNARTTRNISKMQKANAIKSRDETFVVLIHNFCTEIVGFSQIRSVFDPEYECIQVLEGYDRISQYYFQPGDYNSSDDDDESEFDDNHDE